MLKGTKEGIFIEIRSKQDLIDLEEKVTSKKFFYKDTKFLMSRRDEDTFKHVSEILERNGYSLCAEKDDIFKEKFNEEYTEKLVLNLNNNFDTKEEKSLVLKKTLRSGQRIEFDGNVIVLGSTNPGSEVIASGDIYIFGKAMGLLHGGSKGDKIRTIVALRLDVPQIRIANVYAKGESRSSKDSLHTAERAFLDEKGYLIIEEYKPYDQ